MFSDSMMRRVEELRSRYSEEELFSKMALSICPEIFGMEEVK